MPSDRRKRPSLKEYDHLIGKVVRLRSSRERLDGSTYVDESGYYVIVRIERSKAPHDAGTFAWGVSSGDDTFAKEGQLVKLARVERIAADLFSKRLELDKYGSRWEEL